MLKHLFYAIGMLIAQQLVFFWGEINQFLIITHYSLNFAGLLFVFFSKCFPMTVYIVKLSLDS